ncbi:DUF748 domain-containing protein [uncultured Sneathiella sp.]|uniref:DUF748 domain-containing protein n=1 Tax=uncultured Sneathiella sp. TaxID=879315 RepID=UPI0030DDCF0C|tara:strand:- start:26391 stop:27455 length:1065 start_codon:yes stop_codon:yes gene_type:complete
MFKTHPKRKIAVIVVIVIAAVLVAGRLYLPFWVKDYVNTQIALLDGYRGGIQDIDLNLWRGAYKIHTLEIRKQENGLDVPFAAARTVDLSVEWKALLEGAVVAEIDIYGADLNFSKTQTGEGGGWLELVDALSPFNINRLAVHGGRVAYIDYTAEPNINLFVKDIDATVTNLRNVTDKENPLPSHITISGTSIGDGVLSFDGRLNILREIPDFDTTSELKEANLEAFNDYGRAYAAIDFEGGKIGIFSELAAADGDVTGYIKLVATDVTMVSTEQEENPLNALWETLVSGFVELFENQPKDQFALRVPIEGNLDNPEGDLWPAFISIFSNAFEKAFTKNEDGTINFQDAIEKEE